MAESRKRPTKPVLQLHEQACPDCQGAKTYLYFDQPSGQFEQGDCERCLGAGVIEVQRPDAE